MHWEDVLDEIAELPYPSEALFAIDLARLAEAGPPIVGLGVGVVRRHTGARTLGDIDDPDVAFAVEQGLSRNDRRAFMRAFLDAVRRTASVDAAAETSSSAKPAPAGKPGALDIEHPPHGGKELDAWVEHFGVADQMNVRVRANAGNRRGARSRRRFASGSISSDTRIRAWSTASTVRASGAARFRTSSSRRAPRRR